MSERDRTIRLDRRLLKRFLTPTISVLTTTSWTIPMASRSMRLKKKPESAMAKRRRPKATRRRTYLTASSKKANWKIRTMIPCRMRRKKMGEDP
ncbi:hypothetical protein L596_007308 [Steinernema carpocapsae]|nr:hypothetical protein L596_007308 [Steinernema carpocapsae]